MTALIPKHWTYAVVHGLNIRLVYRPGVGVVVEVR